MKDIFKGFYTPSESEIKASWLDQKTIFVFDTNVLLNLYRYTKTTRNDFFKIINKVSKNIWLPYHVGLEYQRNRLTVIKSEKKVFSDLQSYTENLEKNIDTNNLQKLNLNQRLPELNETTLKLQDDIKKLISAYKKDIETWNKKQPDVRSTDEIRKKIDDIFHEKVGTPPKNQESLDEIYKEGKRRYELNIPPGYEDKKEKEDKDNFKYADLEYIPMYGDLIIWKQTIEKAKDEEIDAVIFVTDDYKEDWWYTLSSNGKKVIGARAELRDEIHRESNITSFELLKTSDFLRNGKEVLKLAVKEESIKETISNFDNNRTNYTMRMNKQISDALKTLQEQNNMTKSEIINKALSQEIKKLSNTKNFDLQSKIYSKYMEQLRRNEEIIKKSASSSLLEKLTAFEKNEDDKETKLGKILKRLEEDESDKEDE